MEAELARTAAQRGTESRAVAAVLLLDRFAMRLAAPVLAAFHELDSLLDARLENVLLGPDDRAPGWIAFAEAGRPADGDRDVLHRSLLGESLLPLAADLATRSRAGSRVLRATVAHAVALGYLHLSWHHPDQDRFVDDAHALLTDADLDDLVDVTTVSIDGRNWMSVERGACCLAFRTASHTTDGTTRYCATCPCRPKQLIHNDFVAACRSFDRRHPRPPSGTRRS